jgi:hypothetical protein
MKVKTQRNLKNYFELKIVSFEFYQLQLGITFWFGIEIPSSTIC